MKKLSNTGLLISLAVMLLVLSGIIFFDDSEQKINVDKNLFKVADQTNIDRVVLKHSNDTVELHFDGTKWVVNKAFEADKQLIKVLFATLLQTEPRRPVAQRLRDSIQANLTTKGHMIELYEDDQVVKSYWVGGNQQKTETYYQMNEETPYVVTIPGYRVYVAAIFELRAEEWRDKRIFNFNWQNFRRLSSVFPKNAKENFSISYQNSFFGLEGSPGADTTVLNNYLDAVSLIQTMRYLPKEENIKYDSLLTEEPENIIEVEDIAKRKYVMEIYPSAGKQDIVLGKMSDGQIVILNRADFLLIDRKRSDFLK
jgi:hypothetical protein